MGFKAWLLALARTLLSRPCEETGNKNARQKERKNTEDKVGVIARKKGKKSRTVLLWKYIGNEHYKRLETNKSRTQQTISTRVTHTQNCPGLLSLFSCDNSYFIFRVFSFFLPRIFIARFLAWSGQQRTRQ
ncbi:MAG: hypothetical protein O7C62_08745, partial [Rickettsia endosymbiont of Ixodes persulcatus]|nr:hypothetical protein [Rickettsia endosymbiont of Ixodes persulcatus]